MTACFLAFSRNPRSISTIGAPEHRDKTESGGAGQTSGGHKSARQAYFGRLVSPETITAISPNCSRALQSRINGSVRVQ